MLQGIVTNLSSSSNNNNNNSNGNGSGNNNNFDKKVTIQEIGQETLEREMSREKLQKFESSNQVEEKSERSEAPTIIKVQVEPKLVENSTKPKTFSSLKSSTVEEKSSTKGKNVESPKVAVRHVPIRLDDGKIVQTDPDETVEIRCVSFCVDTSSCSSCIIIYFKMYHFFN
jgi:hypothetical protein